MKCIQGIASWPVERSAMGLSRRGIVAHDAGKSGDAKSVVPEDAALGLIIPPPGVFLAGTGADI